MQHFSRTLPALLVVVAAAACGGDPPASSPDRDSGTAATEDTASEPDVPEEDAAADDATPDEDTSDDDAVTEPDATEPDAEDDVGDDVADSSDPDADAPDSASEDTTPDVVEEPDVEPDPEVDVEPDVPEEPTVTRLVFVGDTGEGNETQYAVSAAIGEHCDARGGCDALVLLGDNIYDVGPSSSDDPLLEAYIDLPYAPLRQGPPPEGDAEDTRPRLPVLCSLGNHDLGGAGLDAALASHYIAYASLRDWFHFPTRTWEMQMGPVHLVALDTNPLAYLGTELDEQGALIDGVVAETDARWTVVVGHHPYRSNGPHGNAGSYEGVPGDLFFLGGRFREFVDDHMCDSVDFYFSGHDHSRQWMRSVPDVPTWPPFPPPTTRPCNTHFAVSGAGAKTSDLEDRDNDVALESLEPGFLYVEFTDETATVEFCTSTGACDYTGEFR